MKKSKCAAALDLLIGIGAVWLLGIDGFPFWDLIAVPMLLWVGAQVGADLVRSGKWPR